MSTRLFFALFCSPVLILAQGNFDPGYIVKTNGDSTLGFIDYRLSRAGNNTCTFKIAQKDVPVTYGPDELSAFGFSTGARFEQRQLPDVGHMVFAEVLVKGKVTLLGYNDLFYVHKDSISKLPLPAEEIIKRDQGKFVKVDNRYVSILNTLLRDCYVSTSTIQYHDRALTKLIRDYNRCRGETSVNKEKPKSKMLHLLAVSGVDISTLYHDRYLDDTFSASVSPALGLGLELNTGGRFKNFSTSIELHYLSKHYKGHQEKMSSSGLFTKTDVEVDVSFIRLPISLRYKILRGEYCPYISLGVVGYRAMEAASTKTFVEQRYYGTIDTKTENFIEPTKSQLGYWGGVGYTTPLFKGVWIFGEFRYERADGFIGAWPVRMSSSRNMSVLVGLRF